MKYSLAWRLTYAANVVMAFVSLSSCVWGALPWCGVIGFAMSLFACLGMTYFKVRHLNDS